MPCALIVIYSKLTVFFKAINFVIYRNLQNSFKLSNCF